MMSPVTDPVVFIQVTLYSMMMSDRREDPRAGLLMYLKTGTMRRIPADHACQRGTSSSVTFLLDNSQSVVRSLFDGESIRNHSHNG